MGSGTDHPDKGHHWIIEDVWQLYKLHFKVTIYTQNRYEKYSKEKF